MHPTPDPSGPARIHASSVLVTFLVIVGLAMLVPPRGASASAPLPAGVYEVQLGSRLVTIEAELDGDAALDVPEDVVVQLSFDQDGHVLGAVVISTPTESFDVVIETFGSGAYRARVDRQQNLRVDLRDDQVVREVAACTPSGLVAATVGLPNHGTTVSQAASGMDTTLEVRDPIDGRTTEVRADFRTLAGARAYCEAVQLAVPSVEEIRAFVAEERAAGLGPEAARAAAAAADDASTATD